MMNPNDMTYPFQDNGSAVAPQLGLTKLEYFAAMAMQGLLAKNGHYYPDTQGAEDFIAVASVRYAKFVLAELNKEQA